MEVLTFYDGEILGAYLVTRDDILICDPESEYYPVVEELGGEVIRLAADSKDYLERMKTGKKELDARNAAKTQELHDLNTEQIK